MKPEDAMRRALRAARRAEGRVYPNPPVGAVVVRGDRVLATGATHPPGGPHAEIVALERARRRHGTAAVRGATIASTLEPCAFTGRTGPCWVAVRDAGIRRVWLGHRDPHPRVAGRGVRAMRRAGIAVEEGVLEAECRELHRGFLSVLERGRPFVALKLAASLDGRIATARGDSHWVTGEPARALVHRLRNRFDAILVGSGTAVTDDPALTVRIGQREHRPIRVVADARLRVPLRSRLLSGPDPERTWLLAGPRPDAARRRAREARGARVLAVPRRKGRLDLARALERLAGEGLTTVWAEGGGQLAASLLAAGVVDEVHWFVASRLVGAEGRPSVGDLGLARLADSFRLVNLHTRRIGQDLYLRGRPLQGGEAEESR